MVEKTPLEDWIGKKIMIEGCKLNRDILDRYQLEQLIKNISYVKNNSSFYRRLLSDIRTQDIKTLNDIKDIPFTLPEDIKNEGNKMVCVSQEEVSRIVTLNTSGTTDLPKRIYFTPEDQELTVDFFNVGMSTFTKRNDRVLILLPGLRPGSIGDLLKVALQRMGAQGIIYGIVDNEEKVEQIILDEDINVVVGIPQQVLALSNRISSRKVKETGKLRAVLLSTDYVSKAIATKIEKNWGCTVYEHYGMTEMGLGGGVFCNALNGYHLREADMLFEIVDINTGKPVEDGQFGEVVFTTLTRKGMPLIRYCTGDVSRFIKSTCSCGTILKTMDKVQYRIHSSVPLDDDYILTMSELEEILFNIEGISNFDAVLRKEDNVNCLTIYTHIVSDFKNIKELILNAVLKSKIGEFVIDKKLRLNIERQTSRELDIKAIKKRKIIDKR